MGLDMYLYRKTYVGNQYRKPEGKVQIIVPDNEVGVFSIDKKFFNPDKVVYIVEEAAYWRKANSIHNFFVEEVQDGVDNCKEHYVEMEVLRKLVRFCKEDIEIIESQPYTVETYTDFFYSEEKEYKKYDIDTELLNLQPTQGFFFGSYDIDEFYVNDLKETIEMITPLLEDRTNDYFYRSSW